MSRKVKIHLEGKAMGTGTFLAWGVDYDELEDGVGNYSVAIVEMFNGRVATYPATHVEFIIE